MAETTENVRNNQRSSLNHTMVEIIKIVMCHFLGDYFMQTDYMAREKGKDRYVLLAHCVCYSVPFAVVFGIDHRIVWLILSHFAVDALKARYKLFGIVIDQLLHYAIVGVLYI